MTILNILSRRKLVGMSAAHLLVLVVVVASFYAVFKLPLTTFVDKSSEKLEEYRRRLTLKRGEEPLVDHSKLEAVRTWWQAAALIEWYMLNSPRHRCSDKRNFGNWAACLDPPYTITAPCLVYSFGIGHDFSFDDAMAKHGCEVHSFDPSMNQESYQRGNRSWFYNMGLSGRDTDAHHARVDKVYLFKPQAWKMRTLTSIKEMLGHTGKTIDVLKIDIEGYEWEVLSNLIETGELSNVRQFPVEFHLFPDFPPLKDYVSFYKSYTKLREDLGFREYDLRRHTALWDKGRYRLQGDIHFVNSFFPYPSST